MKISCSCEKRNPAVVIELNGNEPPILVGYWAGYDHLITIDRRFNTGINSDNVQIRLTDEAIVKLRDALNESIQRRNESIQRRNESMLHRVVKELEYTEKLR